MEQRHVWSNRGQQHDGIVLNKWIVHHPPVRAMSEDVRADDAPKRHEWNALLRRLERRVQRRASSILDRHRAVDNRCRESRRCSQLVKADSGGLDGCYAAGADEEIRLKRGG